MKPGQCQICLKDEAEYIAAKVTKKDLTPEQAARELGVPLTEWVAHFELHIRNKLTTAIVTDIESIKAGLLDKIKEGTESVTRLLKVTKDLYKKLENEDNQKNYKLLQIYATLEGNSIKAIKELAVLEGDITQASVVHIHNNTLKVDKLMNIIMEEVKSPKDKESILLRLETLKVTNAN